MFVRNIEAIRLYRDILRGSKHFVWKNEQGLLWKDVLRRNARKEFDQAKFERDPAIIAKLLLVGRDCLNQSLWKLEDAAMKLRNDIDRSKSRK